MSGLKHIIEKQNLHLKNFQEKNEQLKIVNKNLANEKRRMVKKVKNLEIEFSVKNTQLVIFLIFLYCIYSFLKYF